VQASGATRPRESRRAYLTVKVVVAASLRVWAPLDSSDAHARTLVINIIGVHQRVLGEISLSTAGLTPPPRTRPRYSTTARREILIGTDADEATPAERRRCARSPRARSFFATPWPTLTHLRAPRAAPTSVPLESAARAAARRRRAPASKSADWVDFRPIFVVVSRKQWSRQGDVTLGPGDSTRPRGAGGECGPHAVARAGRGGRYCRVTVAQLSNRHRAPLR